MKTNPAEHPSRMMWCVVALCGLALCLPILLTGGAARHDGVTHQVWAQEFVTQFLQGDFYPRWLDHMNGGLGSPTFFFYPPLPYFAAVPFQPLSALTGNPWHIVAAGATLAVVASGLAALGWLSSFTSARAAVAGAILYMLAPYHLGTDLYVRFAYAELWSFVWMPLVLWAARPQMASRTVAGAARAIVSVAIPFALLCLSHLPTVVLFAAVPLLQAAAMSGRGFRLQGTACVLAGMLLGIGMASFYLLPAWGDREFVSMGDAATGIFHYTNNFLLQDPEFHDHRFWRVLETGEIFTLAAGLYILVASRRQSKRIDHTVLFWSLALIVTTLLTLPVAGQVWRWIPVLQNVQFPWRFGTIGTIAIAALFAVALSRIQAATGSEGAARPAPTFRIDAIAMVVIPLLMALVAMQWYRLQSLWFSWVMIAAAGATCMLLVLRNSGTADPGKAVAGLTLIWGMLLIPNLGPAWTELRMLGVAEPVAEAGAVRVDRPEYRIRQVPESRFNAQVMQQLGAPDNQIRVTSGTAQLQLTGRLPRAITLSVLAETEAVVTIGRYFYPGIALLDASGRSIGSITAAANEGLIQARFPPGRYTATIALTAGPMETLGRRSGLIAASVVALFGLWGLWDLRRRSGAIR
jgi:hypothetical protein